MTQLRTYLVLVLSLMIFTMNGGNVTGCVVDSKEQPVEFATVVLLQNGKQAGGTTTNDSGCFSIENIKNGNYDLKISYVGLKTYSNKVSVNSNTNLDKITLEDENTSLKEVTVTASAIRREADRFVMLLENQPITAGKSGKDILKRAPGVWINNNNNISINGNSGTTVYINDREQTMSKDQLFNFLSSINADDISKIEVIPNAGAEYSANSSGGIIKIYLKKSRIDGMFGSVGASFGAGKDQIEYCPYGNINVKHNKLSLSANAWLFGHSKKIVPITESTTFTNGDKINANSRQDNGGEKYSGTTLGAVYDLNKKNSIGAEVQFSTSHSPKLVNTTSDYIFNQYNSLTNSCYDTKQNGYNWNAKLNYIHNIDTLGSKIKVLANYTFDHNKSNSLNNANTTTGGVSVDSLFRNDTKTRYNVFNGSVDYEKILSQKVSILAGGKYTLNNMYNYAYYDHFKDGSWIESSTYNYNLKYNENIMALYAIGNVSAGRWQARLGLRGEYTHSAGDNGLKTKSYFDLFPNANIAYSLTKKGDYSVSLEYDRTIERPSFWSMSPIRYQISDYSFQTGNPLLKPSYRDNLNFNLTMAYKYSLSVGAFFINDGINQQMQTDPYDPRYVILSYVNETKVRGMYVNAYVPVNITKWLTFTANATYALRGEKQQDLSKGYEYHHILNGNASLSFNLPKDYYLEVSSSFQKKMTIGNLNIGGNVGLDVSANKTFNKNWKVSLSACNLINQKFKMSSNNDQFNRDYSVIFSHQLFKASVTYSFNSGKMFKVRKIESNEDSSRLSKGNGTQK